MTNVTGDAAGPTDVSSASHRVPTRVLRALGAALFAGLVTAAGLGLRWAILRDGMWAESNLELATFIIGIGAVAGIGALIVVAAGLVRIRD